MRADRRGFKLQDFAAHAANVNCLRIGEKSGAVMVTGGDDRAVNLWRVGRASHVLSCSGHQTPVTCVAFDGQEELVAAGSESGSIKTIDLSAGQAVRNLGSHRTQCSCVEFHPYGEFLASGSRDTNLKVWDLRRKTCIQTYKGHQAEITCARFSPDGRWVVSGSADGTVKLWDLTAGRLMRDFTTHSGAITALGFNPSEFLLATAAADRTVKFWDLETFDLVSSAPPDATPVRSMAFTPAGDTLLAAPQDHLRVLGWDPVNVHDQLDVGWGRLEHLCVTPERQLVAASLANQFVSVFVVELRDVHPFARDGSLDDTVMAADAKQPTETPAVAVAAGSPDQSPDQSPERKPAKKQAGGSKKRAPPPRPDSAPAPVADPDEPKAAAKVDDYKQLKAESRLKQLAPHAYARRHNNADTLVPAAREQPLGLDPRQFLPAKASAPAPAAEPPAPAAAPAAAAGQQPPEAVIAAIMREQSSFTSVMRTRLADLRAIRARWGSGDVRGAVTLLIDASPHVRADFLRAAQLDAGAVDLECAALLLPVLFDMIDVGSDDHALAAVESAYGVFRAYGTVIRDNRGDPAGAVGVDLSREQRMERANTCYQALSSMRLPLAALLERTSGAKREVVDTLLKSLERYCGQS